MNHQSKTRWIGVITVAGFLIASYVFARFQGGFASWFIFYASLTFSVYEVMVIINGLLGVQVERRLKKKHFEAGEQVDTVITIKRKYPFPIPWLVVKQNLTAFGSQTVREDRHLVFPWFKLEVTVALSIDGLFRGIYLFEDVQIETGDLFGLIHMRKEISTSGENEILVYPGYQWLPVWSSLGRHGHSSQLVQRSSGDETTVVGARDYVPGDRLSKIHWKASARSSEWKTKEFESHTSQQYMFILDTKKDDYPSSHLVPIFERAVKTAASLCYTSVRNKNPFSLLLTSNPWGEDRKLRLSFSSQEEHLIQSLRSLASVEPSRESMPLSRVIEEQAKNLKRGGTLTCITPVISDRTAHQLFRLVGEQLHIVVFLVTEPAYRDMIRNQAAALIRKGIDVFIIDQDDLRACLVSGSSLTQKEKRGVHE